MRRLLILCVLLCGCASSTPQTGEAPNTAQQAVWIGRIPGVVMWKNVDGAHVRVNRNQAETISRMDPASGLRLRSYNSVRWDGDSQVVFVPNEGLSYTEPGAQEITTSAAQADSGKSDFECFLEGRGLAESGVSTSGNTVGGFFGGLFLGLLGTGIAYFSASEPEFPMELMRGGSCGTALAAGYTEAGKSKKRQAAGVAGLIGTAILVGALVIGY